MEARINYHIRGIFILDEKLIPPLLNKHLTNVSSCINFCLYNRLGNSTLY